MAYLETPQLPEPKSLPHYMVGAASPLWAYFGTVAAGGVAFWWMTRWARPANLEAMFASVTPAVEAAIEPVLELVEAVVELPPVALELAAEAQPLVEAAADMLPQAAEEVIAAVVAPVLDAAPAPLAAAEEVLAAVIETQPVLEAAPELQAAAEPAAEETYVWAEAPATMGFEPEAAPEPAPAPKARVKKAVAPPEA